MELEQRYKKLEDDFAFLNGAVIKEIGFVPRISEGGLAIDYVKGGEDRRLVLGFNELGVWKIAHESKSGAAHASVIKEKIKKFLAECEDHQNVSLEQNAMNLTFTIVGSKGERLLLSAVDLKYVPIHVSYFLTTDEGKDPEMFLWTIQMEDWLHY